jgi:hypothetical protein
VAVSKANVALVDLMEALRRSFCKEAAPALAPKKSGKKSPQGVGRPEGDADVDCR